MEQQGNRTPGPAAVSGSPPAGKATQHRDDLPRGGGAVRIGVASLAVPVDAPCGDRRGSEHLAAGRRPRLDQRVLHSPGLPVALASVVGGGNRYSTVGLRSEPLGSGAGKKARGITMTKNELRKFRGILDARQTELEKFTRNRDGLTIDTSPDELDRIQHATEREMAIGNLERDSNRLREVRAALRRIDTNAFGICLDC